MLDFLHPCWIFLKEMIAVSLIINNTGIEKKKQERFLKKNQNSTVQLLRLHVAKV